MDKPTGVRLTIHQSETGEWFPYPSQVDPVPAAHMNTAINHRAGLGDIAWDLCHGLFGDDGKPPRADIEDLVSGCHDHLMQWVTDLPECLSYTDHSFQRFLASSK